MVNPCSTWPECGGKPAFSALLQERHKAAIVRIVNVNYSSHMIEVQQTTEFEEWHESLRDIRAARRISERIFRLEKGHLGDAKYFSGIGELRIDYGPGYRLYFVRRNNVLIILLCGGDKSSQERDIKKAMRLAEEY